MTETRWCEICNRTTTQGYLLDDTKQRNQWHCAECYQPGVNLSVYNPFTEG